MASLRMTRSGELTRITGSGFDPAEGYLYLLVEWTGEGPNPDGKSERHKATIATADHPSIKAGDIDITIPLPAGGSVAVRRG